jgi:3-hydroxyisobutyrate dehydrogenase-like beta-hydroxyacid dehydrogenase
MKKGLGMQRPQSPKIVAILGFGEVGQKLAKHINTHAQEPHQVYAFDAHLIGVRGKALKTKAHELGVTLVPQLGPWLDDAALVFSAVTGSQAVSAAQAACQYLHEKTHYIDLNTAQPEVMREVHSLIRTVKGIFTDAAILHSVSSQGFNLPLLIAGDKVEDTELLLRSAGLSAKTMHGQPGDASAVKMLRSVFTKGIEALCIECFIAADKLRLKNQVLEALSDLDQQTIQTTVTTLVSSHIVHAGRRLHEVESVEAMLHEQDIQPIITKATKQLFKRTTESAAITTITPNSMPTFEEALKILQQINAAQQKGNADEPQI